MERWERSRQERGGPKVKDEGREEQ